jgi:hypothetical protein
MNQSRRVDTKQGVFIGQLKEQSITVNQPWTEVVRQEEQARVRAALSVRSSRLSACASVGLR